MSSPIPTLSPDDIGALRRRLPAEHGSLAAELPWLDTVECGGDGEPCVDSDVRVVAFNAERGTRFDEICALLRSEPRLRDADVLLLSEVDWGMARSGNRHVARDLAAALGMTYLFGVEFLELTKGDAREAAVPGENTNSLHGNAILSRFRLSRPRVVRLPALCAWNEPEQARVGGRMALIAEVDTPAGAVAFASVHLENRTSPEGRRTQMRAVIDALAGTERAVVAGDLNTSTIDPDDPAQLFSLPDLLRGEPRRLVRPQRHEPLFAEMSAAGFLIEEINETDVATSVPMGIEDPAYWLKLDWMFARGLRVTAPPRVVVARAAGGRVSDHDFLVGELAFLEALGP